MTFPSLDSDATLVDLMSKSELAAAGTLYDRHGAMMYGLALHMLRNENSAGDVVVDVMAEVWRDAETYTASSIHVADRLAILIREHAIRKIRDQPRPSPYASV